MEKEKLHLAPYEFTSQKRNFILVTLLIGVLSFGFGFFWDRERLWTSYLTSFFFFVSLGLGGIFFLSINYLSGAAWSVSLRRFAEAMSAFLPYACGGGLFLLLGVHHLYPWLDAHAVAEDHLLKLKSVYLNLPFFTLRLLIFLLGWCLFSYFFCRNSLEQDKIPGVPGGDEDDEGNEDDESDESRAFKAKNKKLSIFFLFFFAASFSFFSVDLLMSLLPHWFSTIFGIYTFAGLIQASTATLILLVIWVRKKGLVRGYLHLDHLHDLGKYLKGFTVFWAYIAFSQFLLIWYANVPEETEFYLIRSQHGWMWISLGLLVFRFLIPFWALLPRGAKRNPKHLVVVCTGLLFMHYIDIYWLIYPNFKGHILQIPSLLEAGIFVGFLGLFLLALQRYLSKHSMIPLKDPKLKDSISHHVTY